MPGPDPKHKIKLTDAQYSKLRSLVQRRTAPYAEVQRARVILLAYEYPDWDNQALAEAVGCTDRTVRKWRRRWVLEHTLEEAPRSGRPRVFSLGHTRTGYRAGLHLAARKRQTTLALVGQGNNPRGH